MGFPRRRSQTAIEYLLLIGGGLLFVTLIILILRGNLFPSASNKIQLDMQTYFNQYAREYLFVDTFDTNAADRWIPVGGSWSAQNKEFSGTGAGLSYVDLTLSNFSYTALVRSSGPVGKASLLFRMQSSSAFYSLDLANSGSQLTATLSKTVSGVSSPIFGPYTVNADLSKGVYARVDANGTNFSVYLNNQPVNLPKFWASDRSGATPPYLEGLVGVADSQAGEQAFFDDVYIIKCSGQCPVNDPP